MPDGDDYEDFSPAQQWEEMTLEQKAKIELDGMRLLDAAIGKLKDRFGEWNALNPAI